VTAQERRVVALRAALLAMGAMSLAGWWVAAGPLVFVSIALALAVGYGDDVRRGRVALGIVLYCLVFIVLILNLSALYSPEAREPRLVLGLPAATAVLVYLIWPLGASAGLLYALEFERATLSDARLAELDRKLAALDDQ